MRNSKPDDVTAPILEGHLSSALCHMANISHQVGAGRSPEEIADATKPHKEFAASWDRFRTHLDANRVDFEKSKPTLGAVLTFDPAKEIFIGADAEEANKLLSREYRKPFEVPKIS